MKKISQTQWNRYKNSNEGKEAIALFEKAHTNEFSYEEMLALAKRYDPECFKNNSKKENESILATLEYYDKRFSDILSAVEAQEDIEVGDDFFLELMIALVAEKDDQYYDDIPQKDFKYVLGGNMIMSLLLYAYLPEKFFPNFFVMQFAYLKKIAEKYEIELPKIPNRSDYKKRNLYYRDMCRVIIDFALENEINNMSELCAFLYDYELPVVKEELEAEDKSEFPEFPGQAWILVGSYGESEKNMEYGFWQANELTEKGDILLFYEKSPVKALNSVWIAQQNGIIDPFFHYYSNTYIGGKISIPAEQAIKFEDFKNNEYFKNRDKKGNFVSKNFQDCSGWVVTSEDYKEIKRMLASKGFNTELLPKLYEPTKVGDITIELEKDVSEKLLIPRLEEMGWKKDVDFKGEVEFKAGRGKTGFTSEKRPDFCLHITEKNGNIEAKVIIEVKKFMKNGKEILDNFDQGRSYAKWGNAQVLVLCDMKQIRVYQRQKGYVFDENKFIKYSWNDLNNPDKFAELKKLLS